MSGLLWIHLVFHAISCVFHPFHVSVCEITHKPEKQKLEIIYKIFLDDLEITLNAAFQERLDLFKLEEPEKTNELIEKYLRKHFYIKLDGKKAAIDYIGSESDGDSMWIYLEVDKVKKLKDIEIYNALLFETYDDQVNLVHVRTSGKNRSLKMNAKKDRGKLSF